MSHHVLERLLTECILTEWDEETKTWGRATFAADKLVRIQTETKALLDEVDRYREALREARAGLKEAYEYGCEWPIGLDTDSQEQRGMDRDTFIGNMEYFLSQIDVAVGGDPE